MVVGSNLVRSHRIFYLFIVMCKTLEHQLHNFTKKYVRHKKVYLMRFDEENIMFYVPLEFSC